MVTKTRICPCRGCTKAYEQGREDAAFDVLNVFIPPKASVEVARNYAASAAYGKDLQQ